MLSGRHPVKFRRPNYLDLEFGGAYIGAVRFIEFNSRLRGSTMSIAMGLPTTSGDGVNPVDLFGLLTASPVNQTTLRYSTMATIKVLGGGLPGPFATTKGDLVHPVDLTGLAVGAVIVNYATQRQLLAQVSNRSILDQTQWRGWTFVIDPATLQPQTSRNVNFPGAQ